MPNYKLTISYDGTGLCGWQKNGDQPSVAYFLEKAFETLRFPLLKLEGASRTDSGVHAKGQVARIDLAKELKDERLALVGLNSKLPDQIRVMALEKCSSSFHPTLNAKSKTYSYFICQGAAQCPLYRFYSWHVPYQLDLEKMQKGALSLLGTLNFKSLTNAKKFEIYKHHTRTLLLIEILALEKNRLQIKIKGQSFLYKMARNIAGLLVAVGRGKFAFDKIASLLEKGDRELAPMTAPAHGLVLETIEY